MIERREVLKLGAMLGAGAALPSCVSSRLASGQSSRFDWTLHPPEAAGLTRAGLAGVRATVQKHIDADELTGAVSAIARRDKLVWHEAQGVGNAETGAPMRKDAIFRLASSSKPITAACILMLMDEGKLSIDDKVSRFIPSFRNSKVALLPEVPQMAIFDPSKREQLKSKVKVVPADREVTLKDLLTHTAGVGSVFGITNPPVPIQKEKTLADRIPLLGPLTLDFQPGTKWSYSPLDGFDVLGHVVEIVSGMPLDQFMRRRLFEPLEMRDTGFHLSAEQRQRLVPMYKRENNAWKPTIDILGAGDPDMKYLCAAGGLLSTVHDYMQYQEMLLNRGALNGRRLLSREAVALMSTNHVGTLLEEFLIFQRKGWGFGLGVGVVVDPAVAGWGRGRGAFGWDGAHGTDGWVDPESDLAAVYFVQQSVRPALIDFGKAVAAAMAA